MIGVAKFYTSCDDCNRLVKDAHLFASGVVKPVYPPDMPAIMRKLDYKAAWRKCIDEGWYNIQLVDQSLIQFKRTEKSMSYSYLQCPFFIKSFEEYAFERMGEDWAECEDDLREEYDFFAASESAERSVTPVRYDYEPDLYRNGFHPAGHFHFGLGNETRVGAKKLLLPTSFILFIIRQFYPSKWDSILAHNNKIVICRDVRDNLVDVSAHFCHSFDLDEMYLA